ncbi:HNH endonuclease signature motif containing protein [Mycobacterium asiaticum]|uniref:HNH endonuclease signature motif containing protein n=1 Tax=Mycobacterium asiaticum TaxID=1790 RepID=UPI000562FF15|nr:HNH endonuclease signature motif containing protein [Mycobacterium asiaticum]OBI97765.1 hypothetical protein A5661_17050 [Mycobacterium asiaticum]OBJ59434.1 hypothetical protein A9W94_14815 [Mycobacterium asiaticum]ORA14699.1 hypothetical protein BST16_10650 [Mycobacterium asiaticum DSM 44297]
MSASTPQEIVEVLDALEACADRLGDLDFDACGTGELLSIIEGTQRVVRKLRVPGHAVITQLGLVATGYELGGTLGQALADRLRITKAEADRRIAEAAVLGPRRALTGQPLQPVLAATAAAERRGLIGDAQVGVIRKFFAKLPDTVDAHGRAVAEAKLTLFATGFRPDELAEYARVYKDCLKPNGDFDPDKAPEPARNRGITLGKQQSDGLSKISGYISAECRATVEPVLAKLAAPGMCNPADDAPVIDGRATAEAVDRDNRTAAQRNHDALNTALRALLMSKTLGQHHGLPTSIVITTTLAELEAGAGRALTAGGTLLPMSDVIQLASHAHNYLAIFDKDRTLALYHGKRIATPEQRLALLGRHRGCTRPGCTVPGYWTQVHHLEGWLAKRRTHIDELTLACGPDNRMVELRNYITRRNAHGDTEWIPPRHLDHRRPRTNCMHHPERPLKPEDDEPV